MAVAIRAGRIAGTALQLSRNSHRVSLARSFQACARRSLPPSRGGRKLQTVFVRTLSRPSAPEVFRLRQICIDILFKSLGVPHLVQTLSSSVTGELYRVLDRLLPRLPPGHPQFVGWREARRRIIKYTNANFDFVLIGDSEDR